MRIGRVSALTLTLSVSPAHRTAGVLQEVLSAVSQLHLQAEPLLSLALGALLAFYTQQPADQVVLSTPEALAVLATLSSVCPEPSPRFFVRSWCLDGTALSN